MMETCVLLCTSDTWCSKQLEGGVWFVPFFKPGRSAENCKHWIKACSRPLEQMNMNIVDNNRHLLGCTKVSTKDHLLPSPSERSKVSQSLFILQPKPMVFYFAKAKFALARIPMNVKSLSNMSRHSWKTKSLTIGSLISWSSCHIHQVILWDYTSAAKSDLFQPHVEENSSSSPSDFSSCSVPRDQLSNFSNTE